MVRPTLGISRRSCLTGGISALVPNAAFALPFSSLKDEAERAGIIFGAAIEPSYVRDDLAYADLIRQNCRSITAENAMKWNATRPDIDRFDFSAADELLAFAEREDKLVYGHCLVWHEALPQWLPSNLRPRQAEAILKAHIEGTVSHFRGRVAAWDVVNEAIERNDRRSDGLRCSLWLNTIGPEYLPMAFRLARACDRQCRLVLSDYGLEYDDETWMVEKRGTMLDVLEGLLAAGAPIDALGIQAHLIGDRKPAYGRGLRMFLKAVGDLGLDIYITELDVDDQLVFGSDAQRDQIVADHYSTFLNCVLDEPRVTRVTTWGLSDRYSSKRDLARRTDARGVRPLPFDLAFQAKAAQRSMLSAFRNAPRRRGSL